MNLNPNLSQSEQISECLEDLRHIWTFLKIIERHARSNRCKILCDPSIEQIKVNIQKIAGRLNLLNLPLTPQPELFILDLDPSQLDRYCSS